MKRYNTNNTFLNKLGALYPLADLGLVPQVRVRHEGAVQARSEVVDALRVGVISS
jgi:hypothetical protein